MFAYTTACRLFWAGKPKLLLLLLELVLLINACVLTIAINFLSDWRMGMDIVYTLPVWCAPVPPTLQLHPISMVCPPNAHCKCGLCWQVGRGMGVVGREKQRPNSARCVRGKSVFLVSSLSRLHLDAPHMNHVQDPCHLCEPAHGPVHRLGRHPSGACEARLSVDFSADLSCT